MSVVINELDLVVEAPPGQKTGTERGAGAPQAADSSNSTSFVPQDIQDVIRRQQARLDRVRAH